MSSRALFGPCALILRSLCRETREGQCDNQFCNALKYTVGFATCFIIIMGTWSLRAGNGCQPNRAHVLAVIMYAFLHNANLPVTRMAQSYALVQPLTTNFTRAGSQSCREVEGVSRDFPLQLGLMPSRFCAAAVPDQPLQLGDSCHVPDLHHGLPLLRRMVRALLLGNLAFTRMLASQVLLRILRGRRLDGT